MYFKQKTLDGEWLDQAPEEYQTPGDPDYMMDDDEDLFDDEPKICGDCCHFCRCMDDLYTDRGVCGLVPGVKEHDDEMECYAPDKYERCHW